MTDASSTTTPPVTSDPDQFFRAPGDIDAIPLSPQPEPRHLLEQLGPPPFRKTTFPMMGFLASLYEHVAAHVPAAK